MNKLLSRGAVLLGCSAILSFPHDPITTKITWTQEISRIVYKRCAGCHRTGGQAMSLLTYEEARPWAKAIRDEVSSRRMPPWGAVAGIGDFAGDPSLTTPEIDILIAWVEGGAPEGDPVYLPNNRPSAASVRTTAPHHGNSLNVTSSLTLQKPATLFAIRPLNIGDGQSMEAWAVLPDQSVRRLIWLHDYRKTWIRTYELREPENLPAGTQLGVEGAAGRPSDRSRVSAAVMWSPRTRASQSSGGREGKRVAGRKRRPTSAT